MSRDALRLAILEKCNMSPGSSPGTLKERLFRIGYISDFGGLQLIGRLGGVQAAVDYLAENV